MLPAQLSRFITSIDCALTAITIAFRTSVTGAQVGWLGGFWSFAAWPRGRLRSAGRWSFLRV